MRPRPIIAELHQPSSSDLCAQPVALQRLDLRAAAHVALLVADLRRGERRDDLAAPAAGPMTRAPRQSTFAPSCSTA